MKKGFTFAELMISLVVISILSAILYPTIAHFTPNSNKPLFKAAYKTLTNILYEIVNDSANGELQTNGANTGKDLCIAFCQKANVVNECITPDNCAITNCNNICNDNTLTTTNGMRWKFDNYNEYKDPFPRNGSAVRPNLPEDTFRIYVDVNASNNNLQATNNLAITPNIHSLQKNLDANGHEILDGDGKPTYSYQDSKIGIFYYEASNNVNTGIFTGNLPNYNANPIVKEAYNRDNLKNQDTFEIIVNKKGKIVSMSPAGYANLEDNLEAQD